MLLTEKLSSLVRSMALLSLLIDLLTNRKKEYHKAILDALDEEGTKGKEDALPIAARRPTPQWATLLATYRRAIQFFEIADKLKAQVHKLKVLKPDQLQFDQFLQLWNEDKANRLDYYTSGLRRLMQVGDILPVPKNQFWPQLTQRWETAQQEARREHQGRRSGRGCGQRQVPRPVPANYVKWINQADSPVIFTHQFVSRVLKTHWDAQSGQKAVILIFDGLRVDAWEELVRPVLEEKYDVLDNFPAAPSCRARPTSAGRRSRRVACRSAFVSTSENALLENALKTNLGLTVKFKVEKQDETVECGISARYVVRPHRHGDLQLHRQEPAQQQRRPVVYLRRHGAGDSAARRAERAAGDARRCRGLRDFRPRLHARCPTTTFTVPDEVLTDSGDVKYRVGRLKKPLEGNDAKNGVLFKVGDLGIPDKTGEGEVVLQPCAVPPARHDAQATAGTSTIPNGIRTVA